MSDKTKAVTRRASLAMLGGMMTLPAVPFVPVPVAFAALEPKLVVRETGSGLGRKVSVEAVGQFRLVFASAYNWGLCEWYDLVNDPAERTNMLDFPPPNGRRDVVESALFQQVFAGTVPDDPKLFITSARDFFPKFPRSFSIVEQSASKVIVRSVSSPMANAVGVLSSVTVTVTYDIRPDGRIFINSRLETRQAQAMREWRCAVLGLADPTGGEATTEPDRVGWIRSSPRQRPYHWLSGREKYIYAYWSPDTPEPYRAWTHASVIMIPKPGNRYQGKQDRHNWHYFKRFYYTQMPLSLKAGEVVEQDYLIRLGTRGSTILPDISNNEVASKLAMAYLAHPAVR